MTDLPEALITYLATREEQRDTRVNVFLDSLTDYERGLVHDTAVMGYFQGLIRSRDEGMPKDSQTMALVIGACFAYAEQYPTVNAEHEERTTRLEYFVQCEQPDGSWAQCSSTSDDVAATVQKRDANRRARPELKFRLARRTTRTIVDVEIPHEPTA